MKVEVAPKKKMPTAPSSKKVTAKKVVATPKNVSSTITVNNVCAQRIFFEYLNVANIPSSMIDLGGDDGIHQTIVDIQPKEEEDIHTNSLTFDKSKRAMWFLDVHKTKTKYWVNMIDVLQRDSTPKDDGDHPVKGGLVSTLPQQTSRPCWHCRHTFTTRVWGCPLKYNHCTNNSIERGYVEKKFSKSKVLTLEGTRLSGCSPRVDFFETEGIFCSPPCVKAYILDQGVNARYKDSSTLLSLLYFKMTGVKVEHIPRAPSWKQLVEYGGHLTIKDYRATFGKLEYSETVSVRRPYMFCSSKYIEERRIKV